MIHNRPGKKQRFIHKGELSKYSVAQLQEFRHVILGLREAAVNDVKSMRETYGIATAGDGNGVFEREVGFVERSSYGSSVAENAEMIGRQLHLIACLDAALRRLEGGSYGMCRVCGRAIDRMRLLAVPHTQECVACKSHRAGSPATRTSSYCP